MTDNAEAPKQNANARVHPNPNATGAPDPLPGDDRGIPGRETHERRAAWLRGEMPREQGTDLIVPPEDPIALRAPRLLPILSENIRSYAIFLMDVDGIIRYWGEGARLMKWWTKAQAIGAHLRVLYPDGGASDGTAEAHLQVAAENGEYTGEGERVRSDSSVFWAGVTLTALRDDDGVLVGFSKVTRDLGAQRAVEAALKSAKVAAEAHRVAAEAQRLRNLFVASVSHEIRSPLNALLGYLAILERESAGRERQRTYVARIRTTATHLMDVINDLLEVSRIDSGRFPVTLAAARVGRAVEAAVAEVESQAAARNVDMTNAVSGSAAEISYWGDEARVRQVLVNLLSNAIKFTRSGGRVTVSAGSADRASPGVVVRGAGPWAYIRVEDTGEGIAAERLHAIFEPYVQAQVEHVHRGTGLGLSITRRLARLMGGDVSVQSDVGVGSTFVLWLPVAPADAE
jgi:PAS domain S-box-containing protein